MPQEKWHQILKDFHYGYSRGCVAKRHGVSLSALGGWLADIPGPSKHVTGYERLLDLKESVLRDYLQEGVGMRELRRRFGVHEGTVRSFLQAQGVLKERGGQTGVQNPQSKARAVSPQDRDSGKYWARRVVVQALGQPLPQGWVIHHMNECPTDQTLTNLWLFPSAQAHSLFHQRQRENLTTGGQRSASRLASDNGGLWLPQTLDRIQDAPGTTLQSLCDTQA
jgi:hypothetical protein